MYRGWCLVFVVLVVGSDLVNLRCIVICNFLRRVY